ncbi:1585_t:CDS:2, partial [Racocetra persica]
TGGCVPAVIMSDTNLALDLAISEEYEQSYAMHYFYQPRNLLVPEVFEQKWTQLVGKYNESRVVKYLRILYSSKKAWARAYTAKVFTAGIQITSHVKSYNAQVKRLILNSNVSFIELAEVLEASIEEETLFQELNKAFSYFIILEMQKIQHIEIKSCLNYNMTTITKDEMIKYQEPESNDTFKNYSQDQPVEFARSNMNRLFTPMTDLWNERKENINKWKLYEELQDVIEKLQDLLNKIQEDELVINLADD